MSEEWRPVIGFEGWYDVSDLGNVRSRDRTVRPGYTTHRPMGSMRRKGRALSPYRRPDGYEQVTLAWKSVQEKRLVHVAVAEAFLGPCPAGLEVRHLNGKRTCNFVWNLLYGTHIENSQDKRLHGNDYLAEQTHCLRGHPLEMPNLTGYSVRNNRRACLACTRAWYQVKDCRKAGRPIPDVDVVAAEKYAAILLGAA